MGTVYSSWSGTWYPSGAQTARKYRARLDYRTISETRTTVTYGATLYVNVNASLTTSFDGSLNLPGHVYEGSCSMDYGDSTTDKCISEKTITINKETSAKTVTISGKIKSRYANAGWGDWKTATVDISVPAISYSISFDANGGINPPAAQTKIKDIALTLTASKPTKVSYDFVGWNTASDGTGTPYASGSTIPGELNADTILYAMWHISYRPPNIYELRACRVASDASGYNPDVLSDGTRRYVDFLFTEAVSGTTEISGTFGEEEVTTVGETGDIRYMYSPNNNLPTYESETVTVILDTTDYQGNTYHYEYSTFISTENYVWDAYKGSQVILSIGSSIEQYQSFAVGGQARDFKSTNRSEKGNFDIYMDMSIVLNDCTITDSGTALSVTAGADTDDGQLAQAVIDAFDYATAKEILEV